MYNPIDLLFLFSWSFMIFGPLTGFYVGRWAYGGSSNIPEGYGDYVSEKRRIFRGAHVNCFVFPYMCIMWGLTVQQVGLSEFVVTIGSALMVTSTVFMTIPMFLSIKWPMARNACAIGAVSLIGGISIISYGYFNKLTLTQ